MRRAQRLKLKKRVDELLGETEEDMIRRNWHWSVSNQYKERTIRAIVYLQILIGIEVTREQAEAGWRNMAAWERGSTLDAYRIFTEEG